MHDHHCLKLLRCAQKIVLRLEETEAIKEDKERLRLILRLLFNEKIDQRTQFVYGFFTLLKYLRRNKQLCSQSEGLLTRDIYHL